MANGFVIAVSGIFAFLLLLVLAVFFGVFFLILFAILAFFAAIFFILSLLFGRKFFRFQKIKRIKIR